MVFWILGGLAVFLVLFEWNLMVYRRFSSAPLAHHPFVSVLIPCRNEAGRLRECALSLLRQDYPSFEVIAFDDESTDGTREVMEQCAKESPRFRWIRGGPLEPGWTGKNRACQELAKAAKGEWLLFIDADTRHEPGMLAHAVGAVSERKGAFLSTFPRQHFTGFGDELLVPLMFFFVLSYLPMYFIPKKTWRWLGEFSTACGQFLFIRKDVYWAIGGHGAIKARMSEGPMLAAMVKAKGERVLLLDGSPWISCRMYGGFREAFEGFARSLYASMGGSFPAFLFFFIIQIFLYLVPYGMLAYSLSGPEPSVTQAGLWLLAIALPLWVRARIHLRIGMPLRLIGLHVLSILCYEAVLVKSFIDFRLKRRTAWKARVYAKPQS